MIILSKANLVDEGIDLYQIKNSIGGGSIVVGENNGNEFLELLEVISKAILTHEEIDLNEIKNLMRGGLIVVGEDDGIEFSKLLENLQKKHQRIQKV